mmetsp:Transcript_43177/g.101492  ORF Transcript_43177/g.101492 Transcript_43177/m.101492 type:complete len:1314 (-) Transcript_43177:47-3988(-)
MAVCLLVLLLPALIAGISLEAGEDVTCVKFDHGAVKCWGSSSLGALGYGDTIPRGGQEGQMGENLPFISIGSDVSVQSLMTGGGVARGHRCLILTNGLVKCWGKNDRGQLGLGDDQARGAESSGLGDNLPFVDLGSNRIATQLFGGGSRSCAILDNGAAKCWGAGGMYGDNISRGSVDHQMGDSLPQIDFGKLLSPRTMALGTEHACAVLNDSSVKCWGDNAHGSLGYGDTLPRGFAAAEMGDFLPSVSLGSGRTAAALAAGHGFTCALLDDESVKCWGSNAHGSLGYGDANPRGDDVLEMGDSLPSVALGRDGLSVVALGAGRHHVCATFSDGLLKCWGSHSSSLSSQGQLGLGDNATRGDDSHEMGDALPLIDLGTGQQVTDLRVGDSHSCVVLDDGVSVKCFGGQSGALGYEDEFSRGSNPGEMGDALPMLDIGTVPTTTASAFTMPDGGVTLPPGVMEVGIVAAELSFEVTGVLTPEVRAACKNSVAKSLAIPTVRGEQIDCFITLPEGMSAQPEQASLTSQYTWQAFLVVTAPQVQVDEVRSKLMNMSNSSQPPLVSNLNEALQAGSLTPTLIAESFKYNELLVTSMDGRLGAMMSQVAKQEVLILDSLLEGNASQARSQNGMFMAMALRLSSADLQKEGDGFFIKEDGQFEIFVPGQVFGDLEAADLILVTLFLGEALTNFLGETTVSVNMNLFTRDGANIVVSNLSQPISFDIPLADHPEDFVCGVWMEDLDMWSTTAVIQEGTLNGTVMCSTTHLSLFGAVATGFIDTFRCSQAQLLTSKGVRQLWDRSWASEATSLILLAIMTVFVVLIMIACVADCQRAHSGVWSDEHFLIPKSLALDPTLGGLASEDGSEQEISTCNEILEVIRAALRDVADECLAAITFYIEAVRQAFEGLCDIMREAWEEEGVRQHGLIVLACIKIARAATDRTSHLNACAKNRVHPDDPVTIQELYSSQEVAQSASLSSRLARGATTATTMSEEKGMNAESSVKSERTLMKMHASHTTRRQEEQRKVHRIGHTLRNMAIQFVVHGPLGSVYVFSIATPSKIRALLLVCELAGALAVSTLFMAVSGKSRSASSPSDCVSSNDVGVFAGRLVALGLASAVLGGLPVRLLSMLHHRKFVVVESEGCQEWHRQLRAWQWRDAILWTLGLLYAGFCMFYNMLFFANVLVMDHHSWLFGAGIVFMSELVIFPLAALMMTPIVLLVCIIIVATATARSRKAVMVLVQGEDALEASVQDPESPDHKPQTPVTPGGGVDVVLFDSSPKDHNESGKKHSKEELEQAEVSTGSNMDEERLSLDGRKIVTV